MLRERVYQLLDDSGGTFSSRLVSCFIMTLICLNVLAVILESVKSIEIAYADVLWAIEVVSVFIFTIEYLLRAWTCIVNERFVSPIAGRIRFALTPFAIVDLLAIFPFFLDLLIPIKVDLRFIRALRLMRLFRILKLGRYSRSVRIMGSVMRAKREDLLVTAFLASLFIVVAASLLYVVELHAGSSSFPSIPYAIWWGLAKVAGAGGEGVSPLSPLGKLLGVGLVLLGRVGFFAVPAAILASGFLAEMQQRA